MSEAAVIHPLALVEPGACLGAGVSIGPFCHVGPEVEIGDGCRLISHVTVTGATTIGPHCVIHPHAALGGPPQNTRHRGGRTTLRIGAHCTIREGVTMHAGTDTARGETVVGDHGNFLAYCHVAHDCIVGSHVTMANLASLAGHCEVGDHATLGGLSAVHQFVRIGHHAFIGGLTGIAGDVIPYGMAVGDRATLRGLNIVGMRRAGISRMEIVALRKAYDIIFDRSRTIEENAEKARALLGDSPLVREVLAFLTSRGKRHYTTPGLQGGRGETGDGER
jgi:UDP-N-acetylglucosamine acyltransferase